MAPKRGNFQLLTNYQKTNCDSTRLSNSLMKGLILMEKSSSRLLECLLSKNLITEELISRADEIQKQSKIYVGEALTKALENAIKEVLEDKTVEINRLATRCEARPEKPLT